MRKNLRNNILTTFLLLAFAITSCNSDKHAEHADTYTCPMHPTVISDKPGVCPVCGLDLVRKAREGEEVKITEDLAKLIMRSASELELQLQAEKQGMRSLRDATLVAVRNGTTTPEEMGRVVLAKMNH